LHETHLIATIAYGLCAALLFGVLARRIGLSPIIGYMLGGIAVGPHTPGFVADPDFAEPLSGCGRDEEDRARSAEAGFDHHFIKPLAVDGFRAAVNASACSIAKRSPDASS
jgi:hypothetical protein